MAAEEKRRLIFRLYNEGITDVNILSERTDTPVSTVYRVKSNIEKGRGIEHQKGAGRPRKLEFGDRVRLGILASKNRRASISNLTYEMINRGSASVSKSTVRRNLIDLGWEKKKGIPSPLLKQEHKDRRVEWCLAHENFDWDNVIFTDESSVWVYPNNVKLWTKADSAPLYQRPKYSPKFHVWGGVSSLGTTPLCVFEGNLTSERYTDILETYLLPNAQVFYGNDWILQQDNDPKHTAKHSKQWFQDKQITVLDWPSYSPDLNPIENIWGIMKETVNQKALTKIEDMKREVERYWDTITHETLTSLIDSMPTRINLCLEANGDLIKY